jgi:hypothetical protein
MLESPQGTFATGVCEYADTQPGVDEPLSRIYVPFQPEGDAIWHLALVDTGGHFFVPSPNVLESIRDHLSDSFDVTYLMTAQGRLRGYVHRHRITLIASAGEDLEVDVTVFASAEWAGPSIFGYTGVLERIRFAVDPETNRFYFGPRALPWS